RARAEARARHTLTNTMLRGLTSNTVSTRFIRPASSAGCAWLVLFPCVVREGAIDRRGADRGARRGASRPRRNREGIPPVVSDQAAAPTLSARWRASRQPRRRDGDQTGRATAGGRL